MPRNEDSSPGHRRGANGVAASPGPDDETIVNIGLAFAALGNSLAEHGRARRRLTEAQRAASSAALIPVASGIAGDLDTLIIGLRADARRHLG